jgi:hypothetical protein
MGCVLAMLVHRLLLACSNFYEGSTVPSAASSWPGLGMCAQFVLPCTIAWFVYARDAASTTVPRLSGCLHSVAYMVCQIVLLLHQGSICIVVPLRKTATVSQVNLKLHTIIPTVLTEEPSARVTTLLALAAIGVKSTSCLTIVSLQKFENKQPVSIRQLMFNEHEEVVTGAIVPFNEG